MASVTLYLRGDQIGTYAGISGTGNGTQRVVTLTGVQALGGVNEVYTVTVNQVNPGETQFRNGQFVTITAPDGSVVVQNLLVQPDIEQGRGAGDEHLIFQQGKYLFDLGGLPASPTTASYQQADEPADLNRGDNDGELDFADFTAVPCFVAGTLILTPGGERPVEEIAAGDTVVTRDHGVRPVRWAGRRTVAGQGPMAPVRIAAGTFGNRRDLLVSPRHRMVVGGAATALLVGLPEALAPAIALADGRRIRVEPRASVTYVHLLFDGHEIVFAEGAPTESFHPGRRSLDGFDRATREEILALFPRLAGGPAAMAPALPLLSGREARAIARRMFAG